MLKKYFINFLLFFISVNAFAQPTVLYSSINTTPRVPLVDIGLFKQARMQANQGGYQRWAFHKGTVSVPDYSQNWRVNSIPNVLSFSNFLQAGYGNGANYFSGGAGTDGEINPVVVGNYYTFNVMKNAFASNDMEVIETSFNPTIISSVTQSPLAANVIANSPVAVTVTMASAPAIGENVFIRYSTDGFLTSSVVQVSFIGAVGKANIPCQLTGTILAYYAFSTVETLAGLNSDFAAFGVNAYDMATLNVNNNAGPNYSYTVAAAPTNTISFTGSPFCTNAGTASVNNTGTLGGVYSSTAGLIINSGTGAVTLTSSTAGAYTVTYTIAANGNCAVYTATTPITITAAPAATISYAGSPYCSNGTLATVTRTGSAGGVYSSTAGLTINATTGEINIATSTAGTYVVTYTVAAAGGCAAFTTTTSITITAAPTATISYAGSPYCSNGTLATVTRTGSAGGVYSSTAGLTLNATTGEVNIATSTVGTYLVTYTVAAAGGCAAFTTTTSITITAAPTATISYAGSPYCSNGTLATVTRTGSAGGVYSSTAGLTLNATTGEVNIATSIAGTYVVTYSVAAAGGCAAFSTTTNISINSLSTSPTSATASATLICANNGSVTLTANGGSAGTGAIYKWYTGTCGGNFIGNGATLNNVAVNSTTTFFVRIEGPCNSTICQSVTVVVAPKPIVEITIAPRSVITPAAPAVIVATVSPPDNYTYSWLKDNTTNLNINKDRIAVKANETGSYSVTVTSPAGCTTTSAIATVLPENNGKLFIFPTPNNGLYNVSFNNGINNLNGRTINVYDSKGARIFTQKYNVTTPFGIMKVDMRASAVGTYFVELIDANGKQIARGKVQVL